MAGSSFDDLARASAQGSSSRRGFIGSALAALGTVLVGGASVRAASAAPACNPPCPTGQTCSHGICCPEGQYACNGTCVDRKTDVANCGACGHACLPGQVCSDGLCCGAGTVRCGGKCVNLANDPHHCGACGTRCPDGQTCSGGVCTSGCVCCGEGMTNCGGACVDMEADAAHCGHCGTACGSGQVCQSGVCTTPGSALGSPCTLDGDCASGHCVQGQSGKICASVTSCPTCQVVAASGTGCVSAVNGTDPAGACSSGQVCQDGACTSTAGALGSSCISDGDCASGHCVQGQSGKICASVTSCPTCQVVAASGTSCVSAVNGTDPAGACSSGQVCQDGACVTFTGAALGSPCSLDGDCASGHCAQGQTGRVCAAVVTCPTCQVVNSSGTACVSATYGTDPKDDCFQTVCSTGYCNGAGACVPQPNSTICAPGSCSGGTATAPSYCDGAGTCQPGTQYSCSPYVCNGTSGCFTSCSSNAECANGFMCSGSVCQSIG